ncbi:MAG: hypothetical protein ABIA93_02210 [Candidatus Woesearchaeota archaeon]
MLHTHIETGHDKLLALVQERHKISLKNAAKQINVAPPTVITWVEMLEEGGHLATQPGLRDTWIVSNTYNGQRAGFRKRVAEHITGIAMRKDIEDFKQLKEQQHAITDQLKRLDQKLKEFDKRATMIEDAERALDARRTEVEKLYEEARVATESLHDQEVSLAKEREAIRERESALNEHLVESLSKLRALAGN